MTIKQTPVIGIIGGSGIYNIDGLTNTEWRKIDSSFGDPSDELMFGKLGEQEVVFLPRHGRGHFLPPNGINYRANIDALKRVGVTDILSLSAVGSFRDDLAPGVFVIPDQFIDRTIQRNKSFFGPGLVAHVSMAHPVCSRLGDALETVADRMGLKLIRGGTYLAMEGPQFSSLAESELYRNWGCDVIGMTNMPEAKLSREAEICYATVAMVTDYDCWHPDHENVEVTDIIRVLTDNAERARSLMKELIPKLSDRPEACPFGCDHALDNAIITAPESRDSGMVDKLRYVAGRAFKG